MNEISRVGQAVATRHAGSIFTIISGTTIPDRAEIVRAHCKEGSIVELRRQEGAADGESNMGVWLQCRSLFGLLPVWKKIGHVPAETADALEPLMDESAALVACAIVRGVYVQTDGSEAAVAVEINGIPQVGCPEV